MLHNFNYILRNSIVSRNFISGFGVLILCTGLLSGLGACVNRTEHTFEQPKVIPDVVTIRSAINDIIPIGTGEKPIDYQKRDPLAIPETFDELPDPNNVAKQNENSPNSTSGNKLADSGIEDQDTITNKDSNSTNQSANLETSDENTYIVNSEEKNSQQSGLSADEECDESDTTNRCSLIEPPIEYSIPPDNPDEESNEESS